MREVLVTEWACDFCGYQGRYTRPGIVDSLQCPMCGEPVTLVAEYWAAVSAEASVPVLPAPIELSEPVGDEDRGVERRPYR